MTTTVDIRLVKAGNTLHAVRKRLEVRGRHHLVNHTLLLHIPESSRREVPLQALRRLCLQVGSKNIHGESLGLRVRSIRNTSSSGAVGNTEDVLCRVNLDEGAVGAEAVLLGIEDFEFVHGERGFGILDPVPVGESALVAAALAESLLEGPAEVTMPVEEVALRVVLADVDRCELVRLKASAGRTGKIFKGKA